MVSMVFDLDAFLVGLQPATSFMNEYLCLYGISTQVSVLLLLASQPTILDRFHRVFLLDQRSNIVAQNIVPIAPATSLQMDKLTTAHFVVKIMNIHPSRTTCATAKARMNKCEKNMYVYFENKSNTIQLKTQSPFYRKNRQQHQKCTPKQAPSSSYPLLP